MMLQKSHIEVPENRISEFCIAHHIKSLSFFGSVLRDDFRKNSDIDVLVEFEMGYTPGFFKLLEMEEELSSILGNRKIDLRTPEDLSRHFRDNVLREKEVCYEKV